MNSLIHVYSLLYYTPTLVRNSTVCRCMPRDTCSREICVISSRTYGGNNRRDEQRKKFISFSVLEKSLDRMKRYNVITFEM